MTPTTSSPRPDPLLAYDQRAELKGQPGMHALVVGVSAYKYLPQKAQPDTPDSFGLRQLSSAARTAGQIARWLVDRRDSLFTPLATVRLLVAPAGKETASEALAKGRARPDWKAFTAAAKDWRADAATNRENVTFFYFAGHGLKREAGDHLLILQNFGDGIGGALSEKAVDISDLLLGMAPTDKQPEIGRRQLYFFDACRTTNDKLQELYRAKTGSIWDIYDEKHAEDDRVRTTVFSSLPGGLGWANKTGTLFGEALLRCLDGAAAVLIDDDDGEADVWGVSTARLPEALDHHLDRLNRAVGAAAKSETGQTLGGFILHRLKNPPDVDVTLRVSPEAAAPHIRLSVRGQTSAFEENYDRRGYPVIATLPAGQYELHGHRKDEKVPALYKGGKRPFEARPPAWSGRVVVT